MNREEIQALLDAPDPNTRYGLRDRAMLHLAFAGGLRVSELVGLNLADLTLHTQASVHVMGKGRRGGQVDQTRNESLAHVDSLRLWLWLVFG